MLCSSSNVGLLNNNNITNPPQKETVTNQNQTTPAMNQTTPAINSPLFSYIDPHSNSKYIIRQILQNMVC